VHFGRMMRGRHAAAIMGVTEATARTGADYVEIAARLGRDAGWRAKISGRIAANCHKLLRDDESIRGLEDFMTEAVRRAALA
jgi:protein O-GlcNAc transferase